MTTLLTYLLGLIVVGGVLFLLMSFAFGRGEQLAAMPPDGTPVDLPDDRPVSGHDVRTLRLSVVVRGYRMDEVDWVLDQLAAELDERDAEIDRLRGGRAGDVGSAAAIGTAAPVGPTEAAGGDAGRPGAPALSLSPTPESTGVEPAAQPSSTAGG